VTSVYSLLASDVISTRGGRPMQLAFKLSLDHPYSSSLYCPALDLTPGMQSCIMTSQETSPILRFDVERTARFTTHIHQRSLLLCIYIPRLYCFMTICYIPRLRSSSRVNKHTIACILRRATARSRPAAGMHQDTRGIPGHYQYYRVTCIVFRPSLIILCLRISGTNS